MKNKSQPQNPQPTQPYPNVPTDKIPFPSDFGSIPKNK
ncbi:Uncharacterised protein [Anaerobiospirillum thomasii]|nr:Uncharacterised protein [Anaerobiospirillum thomasii]